MGRYESQRAIAARTIYEQRRPRKRPASAWRRAMLLRLAALTLTLATLFAAAWFTPFSRPADTPGPEPAPSLPSSAQKTAFFYKFGGPTPLDGPAPARPSRRPDSISHALPPSASESAREEGLVVLSADELAAISQAH